MIAFFLTCRVLVRALRRSWPQSEFHVLALLLAGCLFYPWAEGWSVLDALDFSVATMSTVGYGDLSPQTDIGKIFTIGYLILGTGTFVAMAA